MPEIEDGYSTRWLTIMEMTNATQTKINSTIKFLSDNNIEAKPVWKPMHLQPLFSKHELFTNNPQEPISKKLFFQGICLPSGSNLKNDEQKRVIEAIKSCFNT